MRELDRRDDGGLRARPLDHRVHECVVTAAVLDDEGGAQGSELIAGGCLVGVRIWATDVMIDCTSTRSCGDRRGDVAVDVGRGHDLQLAVAGLLACGATGAAGECSTEAATSAAAGRRNREVMKTV